MTRPRKISTIKPPQANTAKPSHPTREKLLRAGIELMNEHLPQSITSEMVLKKSGVSKGSLYHHFDDFPHLLEVAMVEAFSRSVDLSIMQLTYTLQNAKDKNQMLSALHLVTQKTQSRALKPIRWVFRSNVTSDSGRT